MALEGQGFTTASDHDDASEFRDAVEAVRTCSIPSALGRRQSALGCRAGMLADLSELVFPDGQVGQG
jgi:hypothetical protein